VLNYEWMRLQSHPAGRAARVRRAAIGAALVLCLIGIAACGGSSGKSTTHGSAAASSAAGASSASGVTAAATRLHAVRLHVPAANRAGVFRSARSLQLPRGWTAEAWALVTEPRLEAWTPQGALLVSSPTQGKVTELTPHAGQPGAAPSQRTLVRGLNNPQGLAFDRVNGREVLYIAGSSDVYRYVWKGNRVGRGSALISGLPDQHPAQDDVHTMKNVVVGSDHTIYVDVGSSSNASPRTSWHGIPRASVLAYRPNGTLKRVWARGIRNGDGLAFAPDGSLWTAVNERDQISYPFHRSYGGASDAYDKVITAYVNNHPPDEVAKLTPGRDLGWPYCDPNPDRRTGAANTGFRYTNLPFTRDAQTNPTGARLNCSKIGRLQVGLPAHSAPLGFHFLVGSKVPSPWANGAVVAGHGSWDRHPPRPPVVYWMPWSKRRHTLGSPRVIVSGLQQPNGNRLGRLADAVPGPDGALYVTDDQSGAVYRIVPAAGH
jgi:glucose/arabinose dehydrogenase